MCFRARGPRWFWPEPNSASDNRGRESKRALGTSALLGWTAWILGFSLVVLAKVVWQLVEGSSNDLVALVMSVGLRCGALLMCLFSTGSYLLVAVRRPRPLELHLHGLLLLLMLPEIAGNRSTPQEASMPAALWLELIKYIPWGVRRVLFIRLAVKKMSALGAPGPSCGGVAQLGVVQLGRVLSYLAAFIACASLLYNVWVNIMVFRGGDIDGKTGMDRRPGWSIADFIILRGIYFSGVAAALASQVFHVVFICACRRLIRGAEAKLVTRGIDEDMMAKVRKILRRHFFAICLSLSTAVLVIAGGVIDGGDLLRNQEHEKVVFFLCHTVDLTGDTLGILLLSGIGLLLLREDPEAGDISAHIRCLLHSAVLTSRVDVTFEGAVFENPQSCCVVSFPGKFLNEWRSLTWLCEQGRLSSACVFLPQTDPQSRFGQHVGCPEAPGKCWCTPLYGGEKPWGCRWFTAWKENIEAAVRLDLDLIVVFFPGQTGRGLVPWSSLGTSDLWDGVGLGGSQKAEVAYLERQGFSFFQEDIETTRLRLSNSSMKRKSRLRQGVERVLSGGS